MYTFTARNTPDASLGTAKLVTYPPGIGTTIPFEQLGIYIAHFRGALLHLFGQPFTTHGDAVFEYVLEAHAQDGNTWVVTAYEGASGPAIGGNSGDCSAFTVAEYLLTLIAHTPPADCEATYYHSEYDSTITYGCKKNVCYYHEHQGRT